MKQMALSNNHKTALLSICASLLLMLIAACGGSRDESTALPTPIAATIETVAQHAGELVVVEGYLVADLAIRCGEYCGLYLIPEPSEDGVISVPIQPSPRGIPVGQLESGVPFFQVLFRMSLPPNAADPYPNSLSYIATGNTWNRDEVTVWTEQMEPVGLGDRIRVTGMAGVYDNGLGYVSPICVSYTYNCADPGFVIELLAP